MNIHTPQVLHVQRTRMIRAVAAAVLVWSVSYAASAVVSNSLQASIAQSPAVETQVELSDLERTTTLASLQIMAQRLNHEQMMMDVQLLDRISHLRLRQYDDTAMLTFMGARDETDLWHTFTGVFAIGGHGEVQSMKWGDLQEGIVEQVLYEGDTAEYWIVNKSSYFWEGFDQWIDSQSGELLTVRAMNSAGIIMPDNVAIVTVGRDTQLERLTNITSGYDVVLKTPLPESQ